LLRIDEIGNRNSRVDLSSYSLVAVLRPLQAKQRLRRPHSIPGNRQNNARAEGAGKKGIVTSEESVSSELKLRRPIWIRRFGKSAKSDSLYAGGGATLLRIRILPEIGMAPAKL